MNKRINMQLAKIFLIFIPLNSIASTVRLTIPVSATVVRPAQFPIEVEVSSMHSTHLPAIENVMKYCPVGTVVSIMFNAGGAFRKHTSFDLDTKLECSMAKQCPGQSSYSLIGYFIANKREQFTPRMYCVRDNQKFVSKRLGHDPTIEFLIQY